MYRQVEITGQVIRQTLPGMEHAITDAVLLKQAKQRREQMGDAASRLNGGEGFGSAHSLTFTVTYRLAGTPASTGISRNILTSSGVRNDESRYSATNATETLTKMPSRVASITRSTGE